MGLCCVKFSAVVFRQYFLIYNKKHSIISFCKVYSPRIPSTTNNNRESHFEGWIKNVRKKVSSTHLTCMYQYRDGNNKHIFQNTTLIYSSSYSSSSYYNSNNRCFLHTSTWKKRSKNERKTLKKNETIFPRFEKDFSLTVIFAIFPRWEWNTTKKNECFS